MKKLNSRLKKQYISDDKPIGLNVTIISNGKTHEEYKSFIDLISWARKRLPDNDRSTYTQIFEKIIEKWNEDSRNKKDQRKIIHIYEVYEAKMYIKLKT